jgi:hypothetical protein
MDRADLQQRLQEAERLVARGARNIAYQPIVNGRALDKLRAWVSWQNAEPDDGLPILDEMIRRVA